MISLEIVCKCVYCDFDICATVFKISMLYHELSKYPYATETIANHMKRHNLQLAVAE